MKRSVLLFIGHRTACSQLFLRPHLQHVLSPAILSLQGGEEQECSGVGMLSWMVRKFSGQVAR